MAIGIGDALLKVGVDKKDFDRDMKGLSGAINKHKKAIGLAMVGMGVAAIGAAAASIKAFADMGDEVQKMALRTGLSTEALSELRHAAEISGASLATIEKGIKKMSKTIVDADEGMATYIRSFDRIGLSAEELMKLSPEDQFTRITEAIAALESPTLRAATAQDIFGRAGTELLPLMDAGAEGLAELRKEAHKLGIVFDQEAAESAANFKDDLTRLNGAVNGLKFTLAKELMPALDAAIPILTQWAILLGPIIENTLNWQAAHDKQIKQQKAWQSMMLERQRALGGLTNEYEESVDALESLLRSTDHWDTQAEETIGRLREEIKMRGLHKEALEEETEAVEELTEAQIEQNEVREETTKMIEDAIEELEYERSTAGNLRIQIDDVIKALHIMGKSNKYIEDTLVTLGDEQDNVLKVLDAFGLSAIEVAKALGIETDEVLKLEDAYKGLDEVIKATTVSAMEMKAALQAKIAAGGALTEEEILAYQRAASEEARVLRAGRPELTSTQALKIAHGQAAIVGGEVISTLPGQEGRPVLEAGGIAMRPMLAQIAERKPEAVIPLDRLEGLGIGGGYRIANLYVMLDSRILARVLGQPLADTIRVKTGAKM